MEEVENPTKAMIDAGTTALWDALPGAMDYLSQECTEEEMQEILSDLMISIWRGMNENK